MRYEKSATGRQLTLLLEEVELPADDEPRDRFLHDLETALESVLEDHDLDADDSTAIGGHAYTAISDRCPQCNKRLQLIESELDTSNGAFATAMCECGWHGDAIYRLIDLHERRPNNEESGQGDDCPRSESLFDTHSSVSQYGIQPRYYPY